MHSSPTGFVPLMMADVDVIKGCAGKVGLNLRTSFKDDHGWLVEMATMMHIGSPYSATLCC